MPINRKYGYKTINMEEDIRVKKKRESILNQNPESRLNDLGRITKEELFGYDTKSLRKRMYEIGWCDAVEEFENIIRKEADECGMIKEGDLIKQIKLLKTKGEK